MTAKAQIAAALTTGKRPDSRELARPCLGAFRQLHQRGREFCRRVSSNVSAQIDVFYCNFNVLKLANARTYSTTHKQFDFQGQPAGRLMSFRPDTMD